MKSPARSVIAAAFVLAMGVSFLYLFVRQNIFPNNEREKGGLNLLTRLGIERIDDAHVPAEGGAQKFLSYEAFQKFAKENLVGRDRDSGYVNRGLAGGPGLPVFSPDSVSDISFPENFAGFSGAPEAAPPEPGFSRTNTQVAGVDEADIIKTDGKNLYVVSGHSVQIIESNPPEAAKIVSALTFNGQPAGLYINGSKLVVYGGGDGNFVSEKMSIAPIQIAGTVFVQVYDISDASKPVKIRDFLVEGTSLQTRMIGEYMYLVSIRDEYRLFDQPYPLPRIFENGVRIGADPSDERFVMPSLYYFPIQYERPNVTTISAINVTDAGAPVTAESFVLDSVQSMYVSTENIYITYTKHLNQEEVGIEVAAEYLETKLPAVDRDRIREIKATPGYILTRYERTSKIAAILEAYVGSLTSEEQSAIERELEERIKQRFAALRDELEKTVIFKFGINKNAITPSVQGEVLGYVLNQFAMDENDGYFRIATTRSRQWMAGTGEPEEPYSNVYVLDEKLNRIGAVENLAPGEQIYSVRFMQGRAYMVTFKQTDPLFAIDLRDPAHPAVLGELKIPGFSTYLHPYSETVLIGIGRNTEENPWGGATTRGIKISLFDISDVTAMRETAKYIFDDYSIYSPALDDHKAFLFSKEKNLLAIPIQGDYAVIQRLAGSSLKTSVLPPIQKSNLAGVAVFAVTDGAISLTGVVDHTYMFAAYADQLGAPFFYGYNAAKRSLYIENILVTLSDKYVKMNNLASLEGLATIDLPVTAVQPNPDGRELEPMPLESLPMIPQVEG